MGKCVSSIENHRVLVEMEVNLTNMMVMKELAMFLANVFCCLGSYHQPMAQSTKTNGTWQKWHSPLILIRLSTKKNICKILFFPIEVLLLFCFVSHFGN